MDRINKYLEEYGNNSFVEVPFNRLDKMVLSLISYINFSEIITNKDKYKINDLKKLFFDKYPDKKLKNYITGTKSAIKFFRNIDNYSRFSNLYIYNYKYKCTNEEQFSAFFCDIDKINTLIVFEGTDDLVSGWLEDCELSYMFPIPAQRDAIKYVNKNINLFSKRKYSLCGHSKGGNLALISGMYSNILIKNKIISITSFDGPGFINESFLDYRKYNNIKPIYDHIIPEYSIIGLLLYHDDDYKVIKCSKKGLEGHDLINWNVGNCDFIYTELSDTSIKFSKSMKTWLESVTLEERKLFVESLFSIFEVSNITDLSQIKEDILPNMFHLIMGIKNIDSKSKKMLKEIIKLIIDSNK